MKEWSEGRRESISPSSSPQNLAAIVSACAPPVWPHPFTAGPTQQGASIAVECLHACTSGPSEGVRPSVHLPDGVMVERREARGGTGDRKKHRHDDLRLREVPRNEWRRGGEDREPVWVAAPTLAQDVHTSCVVPLNQLKMPPSERPAT